jgi:hypothetical protein
MKMKTEQKKGRRATMFGYYHECDNCRKIVKKEKLYTPQEGETWEVELPHGWISMRLPDRDEFNNEWVTSLIPSQYCSFECAFRALEKRKKELTD